MNTLEQYSDLTALKMQKEKFFNEDAHLHPSSHIGQSFSLLLLLLFSFMMPRNALARSGICILLRFKCFKYFSLSEFMCDVFTPAGADVSFSLLHYTCIQSIDLLFDCTQSACTVCLEIRRSFYM